MFKKARNRQPTSNTSESPVAASKTQVNTVIGRSTTIEGNIHFIGVLKVDGMIKGDLKAEGDKSILIINENGRIQGNIDASNVMVNGTIEGTVKASNKVELFQNAKILGDLYYHLLEMEVGSTVNGKLVNVSVNNNAEPKQENTQAPDLS